MKNAIFTSACIALLFTSCKKEDVDAPVDSPVDAIQIQSTVATSYVSDWEPIPAASWQTSSTMPGKVDFMYNRKTPQLSAAALRGGLVKAFAKGYGLGDITINNPMGLPFQFYLPYERMAYPYIWNMDKDQGEIKVGVNMDKSMTAAFIDGQNSIQMRYVVISPTYFTQNNMDAQTMSNMSYTQLMTKLGVNP